MKLATMHAGERSFRKELERSLGGVGVYYFFRFCVEIRDGVVLGLGSVEAGFVGACVRIAAVQRPPSYEAAGYTSLRTGRTLT